MNLIDKIKSFFTEGNQRSVRAKTNVVKMLAYKGGNILIGLLLVPMTLDYVNSDTYGIWLALSSMIAWFGFFDIGIGHGLRNRLTEALAKKDYDLCKTYVSTTYAILTLIIVPLMIILLVVAPLINWDSLLNLSGAETRGLLASICVLIVYFCINFVLNTINVVILADQQPADASMRAFLQQLVAIALIFVLTLTTKGSLLLLCLAYCFAPLLVCLLFNITLFRGRYRRFAPSLKSVDFSKAPDLMKLGLQFFVIQIAGVIQYQMINFIILRYFGASEVTSYNVSYKYFSILVMIWGILTTPIWSAVTDAMAKNEYSWVNNMQRKYLGMFFVFCAGGVVMLAISSWVYDIWVGDKVSISFTLSLWILIYCIAQMFSQIYVCIINGTGKLKVQMYACFISPFVFIGVCWLGIHYNIGIISVLIAAVVCNFNGLILAPLQSHHILKKKPASKDEYTKL